MRGTGRYRGRETFGSGICCREKENKEKRDTNSKELFGLNRRGSRAVKTSLSKRNSFQFVSASTFQVHYVAYGETAGVKHPT